MCTSHGKEAHKTSDWLYYRCSFQVKTSSISLNTSFNRVFLVAQKHEGVCKKGLKLCLLPEDTAPPLCLISSSNQKSFVSMCLVSLQSAVITEKPWERRQQRERDCTGHQKTGLS